MSPSSFKPNITTSTSENLFISLASLVDIYYHQPDHPLHIEYYGNAQTTNEVQFRQQAAWQGMQETGDQPFVVKNIFSDTSLGNEELPPNDEPNSSVIPKSIKSKSTRPKNKVLEKRPVESTGSQNKQPRRILTLADRMTIVRAWLQAEEENKETIERERKPKTQTDIALKFNVTVKTVSECAADYHLHLNTHPSASIEEWGGKRYRTQMKSSTNCSKVGNVTKEETEEVIRDLLEYFSQLPEGKKPRTLSVMLRKIKKDKEVKKRIQAKLAEFVKNHPGKTSLKIALRGRRFPTLFSQYLKSAQEEGLYTDSGPKTCRKKASKRKCNSNFLEKKQPDA